MPTPMGGRPGRGNVLVLRCALEVEFGGYSPADVADCVAAEEAGVVVPLTATGAGLDSLTCSRSSHI